MKNRLLLAVIAALVVAVAILAWLHGRQVAGLDPATLVVYVRGEEIGSISLEEITKLGQEEFSQILRSAGKGPVENRYTGLPLIQVLHAVRPGLVTEEVQVSLLAIDGYAVVYSGEELLRPDHIYLVWLRDGKKLGAKASGGIGPLLVIPRQNEFGQYWCKYVVGADIT